MHFIPGGPASSILGMEASPQEINKLNEELGLNKPFIIQYMTWLINLLKGNFGESYFMGDTVNSILLEYCVPTISLALLAEVVSIIAGMTLAIISCFHKNSWMDHMVMFICQLGQGIPSFVVSLLSLTVFAVLLRWLPVSGYRPPSLGLGEHIYYLILPALSLSFGQSAYIARIARASLLKADSQPYILNAKLKGLNNWQLFSRYLLRNSLIPIITAIGQSIGQLLAGSIIVETIFGVPGLGQLLINSVSRRDYAVIQGVILIISVSYILINLLIDMLYLAIDPRISIEGGK